jgi:hypothetical protein
MQIEHQENHNIETPSDRNFGFTVGGILALIEGWRFYSNNSVDLFGTILLGISIPLIVFALIYPSVLAPLNRAWMKLGLLMYKIVNPIIMFLIYLITIIPIGLILKLMGKDPLRLKLDKDRPSYWIKREPTGPTPESMKNQF